MRAQIIAPALALVAVFGLLWAALAAAPPVTVDLGAPGDAPFLGGFYSAEAGDGASFRWSGPEARLVLHGASIGPSLLTMRMNGERLVTQGEPLVTVGRGARGFAAFDAGPGWRVYQVLLPAGAVAGPTGEALPLELRTAVSAPGAGEEGRDYRALGAPVDRARSGPVTGSATGALPRALWLAWMAGAIGAVAGLAGGARRGPLVATGVMLATGAGLALWAWRSPAGLALALPPAPWTLGGATALLAAIALRRPLALGRARADALLAGGLGAVGAGLALMHTQAAIGAGVALAAAGLLALSAAPGGLGEAVWAPAAPAPAGRRHLLALGAIFGLALGLRLFRLDELPFGLWRDEARHGLVALRIAEDPAYRPVYVLDLRVHLPGLGMYPFAAAVQLFGAHLWSLRAATALAGALTVLPVYAVGARLSGRPAVGLGAALLLAASSWHLSISRLAFPTVFEPLLSMSAWALLLWALPSPGGAWKLAGGFGAGLLLGAAAQTYHTGRVTPIAAGLICLLLLGAEPRAWRHWLLVVGAAAAGFALAVAPLAAYAVARPGDFNDRVGDVFLLGEAALRGQAPLTALDANLGRHLLMFTAVGDANGRHHAPLRPLLDIVAGFGLLLGLAALLRSLGDWRARLLLGALAIGLLPGLLAVDAPHAMRTFGAVAPACLVAALGWGAAWQLARGGRVAGQGARPRAYGRSAQSLGAVGLAGAALVGLNAWLYFGVMPGDPRVFAGFYPVQSQMGVYVGERGGAAPIYVPAEVREHPSFAFLASGSAVGSFDPSPGPGSATVEPPPHAGATFLLSGYFAEDEAAALGPVLGPAPGPAEAGPAFPDGSGATFYVYRAP